MDQKSPEWRMKIAMTTLNEMMRSSFFSICAVNEAADVLGVNARLSESYRQLHALHCIDWDRMSQDIRTAIPEMIVECLGQDQGQFAFVREPSAVVEMVRSLDIQNVIQTPKPPLMKRILARLTA